MTRPPTSEFLPDRILTGLGTTMFREMVCLPETGSTNDVARDRARAGAPEGLVVLAERQTRGRGRRGRAWESPAGLGLWFSVLLRPDILPRQGPSLAFLAAAAVREAVAAAGGTPVFIKWPNDVVAGDGGKLAGILVEMDATQSRIRHCIVGVGVNVNQREEDFPPELRAEAVSVRQLSGSPLDRVALLRAILAGFASRYSVVVSEGFGPLLDEVRRHSATVGRTVRVLETTGEAWDGRAVAIQDDGALLVEPLAGGAARAVYAADVSIRPVGRRDHGAQAPGAQAPGANAPGTKTPPGPGFGQEPGERQGGDPV